MMTAATAFKFRGAGMRRAQRVQSGTSPALKIVVDSIEGIMVLLA